MNRLTFASSLILLSCAMALSSCGGDPELADPNADGSGAVGEVEGGSISDGMLPLESVTSKAPARGGSETGDETDGDAGSTDPIPQPAVEAAPEASTEGS